MPGPWDVVDEQPFRTGTAPRAVYGGEWDVVQETPLVDSRRPIETGEAARRGASGFYNRMREAFAAPFVGGAEVLSRGQEALFGNRPEYAEAVDRLFGASHFRRQAEAAAPQRGERADGVVARAALEGLPELGGAIPEIVYGVGAAGRVPRVVDAAARPVAAMVDDVVRGLYAGTPMAARTGTERERELRAAGVDPIEAGLGGAATSLMTQAQFGLPAAMPTRAATLPGRVASRAVTGGTTAATANTVQTQVENALAGLFDAPELARDPYDPAAALTAFGAGGVFGQMGPRIRPGQRRPADLPPDAPQGPTAEQRADFDTYRDLLAANNITDISDPRALSAIERILASEARRAERRPGDQPLSEQGEILDEIASGERSPRQTPWAGREAPGMARVLVDEGGRAVREDDLGAREGMARARQALSDEQLAEVTTATGLSADEIRGLGPMSQQRLYLNVRERARPQGDGQRPFVVSDTTAQDAGAELHSPASRPGVPGERMGPKYDVISEGAGEERGARLADETPPIDPQAVARRNSLLEQLAARRAQRDALASSERYRDLRRRRDVGEQFDEKTGKELRALEQQEERMRSTVFDLEGGIYDLESRTEGGSRTGTGTSDRPFRGFEEGRTPEQAEFIERSARERARAEQQAAIDRLEAEWRERQRMREERARAGEQRTFDDATRGAETKYAKGTGAKFSGNAAKRTDGAPFATDEFGFVSSDKGGPIMFGHQRDAGWWILRVGNKGGTDQVFQISNHPSGKGFTVQVTHINTPGGGGGAANLPAIRTVGDGAAPKAQPASAAQAAPAQKVKPERTVRKGSAFLQAIRSAGGSSAAFAGDIGGDKAMVLNRRMPGLMRKDGMTADGLLEWAEQNGYLTAAEVREADKRGVGGGQELARNLVRRALNDEDVLTYADQEATFKRDADQRASDEEAEHEFRMKNEPEYRAEQERAERDRIAAEDAELVRQAAEDVGLKPEDQADVALVAEAARIDENAVERLSIQHPDGGTEFMDGVRRIINGERPRDEAAAGGEKGEQPAGRAEARPDFDLNRQSEAELRKRADDQRRADEEKRRVENAPPPEEFTLTGSNRPADEGAARGQRGLFEKAGELRDEANNVGGKGTTLFANPLEPVLDFARKLVLRDGGERIVSDVKQSVTAVRDSLDGMFNAKAGADQNLIASMWRTLFFSNQGVLQRLENITGSAGIKKIRHLFDPDLGRGSGVEQTYHEAVSQHTRRWENRMWSALDTVDPANHGQLVRLLQNRHAIRGNAPLHRAAGELAKILDEAADYLKKAGVDLGDVKDYFPRMLDAMKIMGDPAGFMVAAKRAYQAAGATAAEAAQLADNLHRAVVLGDAGVMKNPFLALNNAMPNANFAKNRKFTAAADDILRDFLIQDPADVLNTYIRKAVRRAEFERRFGGTELHKDGSVKTHTAKWDKLRDELISEGNAKHIPEVVRVVQSMVGEMPSSVGLRGRQVGSWMQSLTVLQYLRHAAVTSLPEPFIAAIRTGRPMDAPRTVGSTLWDLSRRAATTFLDGEAWFKGTSIDEARQIAEMIGAVESHLSQESTILLQSGGDIEGSRMARGLANRATFLSGLRSYTDATRVAMTNTGMHFLRSLSGDVKAGKKGADFFLRELGIKNDDQAKFADWVLSESGDMKGALQDGGAMAEKYSAALGRVVDGVIMNPGHQDKPRFASHPVGRVAYALMSYLYAFQQNVLNRAVRMARRGLGDSELTARERVQMFAPMAMLPMLAVAQYGLLPLRDALFETDPERRKKKDQPAAKGTVLEPHVPDWITGSMMEAVSRSGITGAADPLINMMISAKYERDPSTALLGPTGANWQKLVMDTAKFVTDRNSPNTNTHERQLAADVYNTFVDPVLSIGATRYLTAPAAAAATQALGVKGTREAFVEAVAGPENKRSKRQVSVTGR